MSDVSSTGEPADVSVREAESLGGCQHSRFVEAGRDLRFRRHQPLDPAQKPRVHGGHGVNSFQAPAATDGLGELPQTVGGRFRQAPFELAVVNGRHGRRGLQRITVHLQRSHGLEERLFEGAPHGRHLANRLHGGTETRVGAGELLECETWDLDHHVVEGGFEGSRRRTGDVVHDLVEPAAEGDLGGDAGDREAGGLGGQRRGPRNPRVHLDHHVAPVLGVDRELDIGAAGRHPHRVEHGARGVAQHLVFAVGEGLCRRHGDRVAGVDPHGVEVFDRAHHDEGAGRVAHDLELELLPAQNRGLHQHLVGRGGLEPQLELAFERGAVVGHAATPTAEGEGRADDGGQTDNVEGRQALFQRRDRHGGQHRQTCRLHGEPEGLAVLGQSDRPHRGAEQAHTEPLQDSLFLELDRQVEGGLTAEGGDEGVGAFLLENRGHGLGGQWLHIGAVGEPGVGHNGRRVGIHQDDPATLFAQRSHSLHP